MSRLISTEAPGTMRNKLLKLTYLTASELIEQTGLNNKSKDMAAFIVLSLTRISDLVDQTASAWEEMNYWLKSDLFRKEWAWVSVCKEDLKNALLENDWPLIVEVINAVLIYTSVSSKRTRFSQTEPWKGAYLELQARQHKIVR